MNHKVSWGPLAGSYFLGYLWVKCMLSGLLPDRRWDIPLFTAAFFLWGWWALHGKRKPCPESVFFLVCTGIISLCMGFHRCRATDGWTFLALHGFAAYWVLCRSGVLIDGETGPFLPLDALTAGVIAPFGVFFLRIRALFSALRTGFSKDGRSWVITAVVIILTIPVLTMAGGLLSEADYAFGRVWEGITSRLNWELSPEKFNFLFQLLLSLPVGAYLWGLVGGSLRRQQPWFSGTALRQKASILRLVPAAGVISVLSCFAALYLLFFIIQAGHIWAAFFGRVPGSLTAAQYAREGFFQLCAVMTINFGLLLFAARCSRIPMRSHRILKAVGLLLMGESLLLALTAASRLWLYILRFGFTPRRLLGVWAVGVLSVGCILAVYTILRPSKVIGKWLLFAVGTFTLLCLY